jgi:hypothetical protein
MMMMELLLLLCDIEILHWIWVRPLPVRVLFRQRLLTWRLCR